MTIPCARFQCALMLVSVCALGCGEGAQPGAIGGGGKGGSSSSGGSGASSAGAGSGGLVGSGGSSGSGAGGVGTTGGAQGSGGAGVGADSGSGGSAGGGGATGDYPPPPRPLAVAAGYGSHEFEFGPAQAATGATQYHAAQRAFLNATVPLQAKLVVTMGGIGTGPHHGGAAQWSRQRGYHVLAVDMWNENSGEAGTGYLETWSGEDVAPDVDVSPLNSVQNRVKTGLTYLQGIDPAGDWAFYLQDGEVRWNDVILFGYSYGGQAAVAATKYVAVHRVVATSAPNIPQDAPWLTAMPSVTPVSRCYAISGEGEYMNHLAVAGILGWPGEMVNASQSTPPYSGSSRLWVDFGHSEFCSLPDEPFDEICEFVFGYPVTP